MLGIFGRKSPGELAFQSAQRREKEYEGSGAFESFKLKCGFTRYDDK